MDTYAREQMDTVDNLLREGDCEILGRLTTASNASLLCKLSNEVEEIRAIYKPIAGEKPLWDFPNGNLASREVATYLVSEALGLNVVPLTIMREGPYGLGSFQYWIEDVEDATERFMEESEELRRIALLDVVVNNTDRKIGHLLFKEDEVFGCDHGVTFHEKYKLRTVLWQFADLPLTDGEVEKLRSLEVDLEKYLVPEEIDAMHARIQLLLEDRKFPLPPTDWPAVPWPPV